MQHYSIVTLNVVSKTRVIYKGGAITKTSVLLKRESYVEGKYHNIEQKLKS
jgi:hypothetical protein